MSNNRDEEEIRLLRQRIDELENELEKAKNCVQQLLNLIDGEEVTREHSDAYLAGV
ncbi:hypothetical protein MLD52_07945 [Puniceicoccaceae bacterium K14]|nr:hypothetical protein [Puniceicoccaceae bacterium K14]